MLSVGVIGVGAMGRRHAEHLASSVPGARLIAVADPNEAAARDVASMCSSMARGTVSAYRTAEELIHDPDVTMVVIAGPAGVHAAQVRAAAGAKKHIFCEKPLALSLDDAVGAADAAREAGVAFQIGFMRRYDPGYAEAKRHIDAGAIGRPVLFKAVSRDPSVPPVSYLRSPLNAGLYLDSAIHDFDLARWLMGAEVVDVSAFAGALVSDEVRSHAGVDSALVNLRYVNGRLGNVECYWQATYGYDIRTEVVGERGAIQIGRHQQTPYTLLTGDGVRQDSYQEFLVRFEDAYLLEMRDFVSRVNAGKPPAITGEDGVRAVAIAVAAMQSTIADGVVTAVPHL